MIIRSNRKISLLKYSDDVINKHVVSLQRFVEVEEKMPLEGLEEEGLPKNPDLQLMQLKFLVCSGVGEGVALEEAWGRLLEACKENCEWWRCTYCRLSTTAQPRVQAQLRVEMRLYT